MTQLFEIHYEILTHAKKVIVSYLLHKLLTKFSLFKSCVTIIVLSSLLTDERFC